MNHIPINILQNYNSLKYLLKLFTELQQLY